MLVHCSQDCTYQKDGYCTMEPPSSAVHYEPNGCVRCIREISRSDYESGKVSIPAEPQMPAVHF